MTPDSFDGRIGRPGDGGRQPLATPFTASTALAEVVAELGPPISVTGGARLWLDDPEGDGIEVTRLSGRDIQGGETAFGQVEAVREVTRANRLRTRLIVVTTNNSGGQRYEDRPDYRVIEESIRSGWCKWVCWRAPERIGRDDLALALFYDLLKRTGTRLYLTSLGRAVDWRRDRLELGFRGLMAIEERERIKERTHGMLERTWVRGRRGWPGKRPFGFRRNWATKYLEVDPEQWPYVKFIHLRYATLDDGRGAGAPKLRQALLARGCELSASQIRRILQDPIYVTGEYTITYQGAVVPAGPVTIPDPIPADVFQRNQELLRLRRGGESRTPPGTFALNGLRIRHKRCMHLVDERGRSPVLRGRSYPNRDVLAYRHWPYVPRACRGFVVDRDVLENAVFGAVASLEPRPVLTREWEAALRMRHLGDRSVVLAEYERAEVARQIEGLERGRARLARNFRQRLAAGDPANEIAYWDLVSGINTEIEHLQRLLEDAELEPSRMESGSDSVAAGLADVLACPDGTLEARARRTALIEALVEEALLEEDNGALVIELRGPLLRASSP